MKFVHLKYSVIFLTILLYLPYFSTDYFPQFDGLLKYQVYSFTYENILFTGEIPLWSQYGNHGGRWLINILRDVSPTQYFTYLIGLIFRINNILILYKISILLEQLIFITGIYYYCSNFLKNEYILIYTLICCLTLINPWLNNPQLNHQFFYLQPWVINFLLLFLHSKKVIYFHYSLFILLIGTLGNTLYLWPVQLLSVSIFGIFYIKFSKIKPFKPVLNPNPIFIFYINIILIISLIFASYFSIDQSVIISRSGLFNSIHDFLTYSRISVDKNLLRLIDPFNNLDTVTTCYIGIVPILLIFKFWNCKNCLFNVSLITSLSILWLSFGGVFSLICYFFPGMALYRHISFMIPLASFYLVISSSHAMYQFNCSNIGFQISNQDQGFYVNTICLLMIMDIFLTFIIY